MSPFEIYLRTGRIVDAQESKFNPWHDIETGRFTFRNQGRYYGPGSSAGYGGYGGGSFGGGGASGSWEAPKPKPRPKPKPHPEPERENRTTTVRTQPVRPVATTPAPTPPSPKPEKLRSVARNGYDYKLDTADRPREISGDLQSGPSARRSRRTQVQAGGADRRATDEGGHYIASRFNGPSAAFNHFAQDRNFNRGAYREMERGWGKELAAGRKVHVRILPEYAGNSRRPHRIVVRWSIDGRPKFRAFDNTHGGGVDGGR